MGVRAALGLLLSLHTCTVAADYTPAKVAYDLSSGSPRAVAKLLDRLSLLQNLYGNNSFDASIVVVIHEAAIPFFTLKNQYTELQQRAKDLTLGEVIQFRVCRASAKLQGFMPGDFDHWIQLVPMADAEIIMLQHAGYAYIK